jgi:hypothetical protein
MVEKRVDGAIGADRGRGIGAATVPRLGMLISRRDQLRKEGRLAEIGGRLHGSRLRLDHQQRTAGNVLNKLGLEFRFCGSR